MPSAVFVIRNGILNLVTGVDQFNSGGFDGDTGTHLWQPGGLAFDTAGNLYISDFANHRIRRLSTDGTLTTIAGSRRIPDGSFAPAFRFGFISGVVVAPDNSIDVLDTPFAQIHKIQPDGRVTAVAGNGFTVLTGDGGPAASAGLGPYLNVLASDSSGDLYVHSTFSYRIREITPDGTIRTIAGNGLYGAVLDVSSIAAGPPGAFYFWDQNGIHAVSGAGVTPVYNPGFGPAIALSPSGALHAVIGTAVYRIDGSNLVRVAGTPQDKLGTTDDGVPAIDALCPGPTPLRLIHLATSTSAVV